MSFEQFLLTIELKKRLHLVSVEAKNETSARLRLLAEFKEAKIISASKIEGSLKNPPWKRLKAIEIPHFLLKKNL